MRAGDLGVCHARFNARDLGAFPGRSALGDVKDPGWRRVAGQRARALGAGLDAGDRGKTTAGDGGEVRRVVGIVLLGVGEGEGGHGLGEDVALAEVAGQHEPVARACVRTGERRQVSARAGINGAPAYSPDGSKLALTLSGSSGNLDVYVLDLATQALTRITDDPAIDTEPAWSPDGKSLYFTSDRSGGPQIYRVSALGGEQPKRLTFGVAYAARARISPDGTQLAMVVRDGPGYRIAVQDLASGQMRVLSHGTLDESPSFAPNGAQLIYDGRERGQGVLAMVSIDGQVTQRLKSEQGEVREPVWGPFPN